MQASRRPNKLFSIQFFHKTASLPSCPSKVSAAFGVGSRQTVDGELARLDKALFMASVGPQGETLFKYQITPVADGYNVQIFNASCFVLQRHGDSVTAGVTERNYSFQLTASSVLVVSEGSGICGSDQTYLAGSRKELLGDQGKVLGHEPVARIIWMGDEAQAGSLDVGARVAVNPFIAPTDKSLHQVPHLGPDQRYKGVPGENGFLTNGPVVVSGAQLVAAPRGDNAYLAEPLANGVHAVEVMNQMEVSGAFTEHTGRFFSFTSTDPTPSVEEIKAMPRGSVLLFEECPTDLTAMHFTEIQRGSMTLQVAGNPNRASASPSTSSDSDNGTRDQNLVVVMGDGIAGQLAAFKAASQGRNVVLLTRNMEKFSILNLSGLEKLPGQILRMKMEDFILLYDKSQSYLMKQAPSTTEDLGYGGSPTRQLLANHSPFNIIDCCGDSSGIECLLRTEKVAMVIGIARPKHVPESFATSVNGASPFPLKFMYRFSPDDFREAAETLQRYDLSGLVTLSRDLEATDSALAALANRGREPQIKVLVKTAHALKHGDA